MPARTRTCKAVWSFSERVPANRGRCPRTPGIFLRHGSTPQWGVAGLVLRWRPFCAHKQLARSPRKPNLGWSTKPALARDRSPCQGGTYAVAASRPGYPSVGLRPRRGPPPFHRVRDSMPQKRRLLKFLCARLRTDGGRSGTTKSSFRPLVWLVSHYRAYPGRICEVVGGFAC